MENLKSEQVLNIIGHHYFKHNSNDRYLFGDNINRVRYSTIGSGGSFNIDTMLTQSGTKQGVGRGTIDRFKNNSNDVRNYNPGQQQQTQENPVDQITHTVSSLAELESITQGQYMNVQLTPAAYAALAQGKQVKLTLQKMPPQRVNMLLPLLTTAMAAFGGANGAAYNDALFNAINPQLKKAEDFIQKNGTKYSLNPFGGAQADNIKASIEILETDAPKRDTGKNDIPIVSNTLPPPPKTPKKPEEIPDVRKKERQEQIRSQIRDVSAHDSGKVDMIKKTTTGGVQTTQPVTPLPPSPVAEGVTVPKVDAKKVQTPNLEGKVIGKFQGFFDNSIYSTTSKLTFTKPLEPQSHFDTKEQALFAAQSASSAKGQAFVVVKNAEGGFDVHGVKATLPETFTQKSTQEQIKKAEQVTGYSVADINTDGAEIAVDSIVTADAQVFSSPEVHGNRFSGNHFNKQQVPQEYAPVNLKLAELDRKLGDKDIKVTSFQGKFSSQDQAEAMAAKLAEGGKQDAVVLKSGNQFFVYTTTEIMDSGDKGKIHDFNPDATKGFEVVSFAKSDPNKSNEVSLLRKTEDGVFSTEAKIDPKIQATPYNPSAKKDSNTLIGEATTLQGKISALNDKISGKTLSPDELAQAKAELTTLKAQLTTLTDEVKSLDSGNANVRKLKEQVRSLSDTVGKLETNLNKFGEALTVHTQKVEEAKKAPTTTTDETMTFDTNFFTSSTGFREQAQTYIDNKGKLEDLVKGLKNSKLPPTQLGFKDKASLDGFVGRMEALLAKTSEGPDKLGEFLKSGNGPNRNDIAHLVIRPDLDTSTPNANGNSGITKEGNNGIFFSTTRDVETSYVSKLIGSGSISQEEYRRGLVVLALSDAFGGDHGKVGDLLDPNKTPDLKQAIKDLGIKLTPKQEELVDLGIPKAGQPKSKVDAEINKLVAHIRDTQSNSFIETRTKTEPFSGKASDYNIKAMGAEMVLRHKKGSEGEPVHQIMDGLVGAQHVTCLQETFVLRAQSLTDVAQMANGQAPLNRPAKDADWSKLSTELGIPVDKLKEMVKVEGSIDNPDKARLDTIITSLRNSSGIDQEKLQKAFSSISTSEFESMDVSSLTSSQKQAFIDSGIKPEQLQSGKVSALFTGENRTQILGKVKDNLTILKNNIIGEAKGLDLSLHPELAQLAKEIDTVSSDIDVVKTNKPTTVTVSDDPNFDTIQNNVLATRAISKIEGKSGLKDDEKIQLKALVDRYNQGKPENEQIKLGEPPNLTSEQSIQLLGQVKKELEVDGIKDDPRAKEVLGDDTKGVKALTTFFTDKKQETVQASESVGKYQDATINVLKQIKEAAAQGKVSIQLNGTEVSLPEALKSIQKDYTKFALDGHNLDPAKAKETTSLFSELDLKLKTNVAAEVRDILTLNDRANGIVDGALEKSIASSGKKPLVLGDKEGLIKSALDSLPEGKLKTFVTNALSDKKISEDELNTLLKANYKGFDNEKVSVLVQAVVDKYKSELPQDDPQKKIKINILSDMNNGKSLSESLSSVQKELFPNGTKAERTVEKTGSVMKAYGTSAEVIPSTFVSLAGTAAKIIGQGMEHIRDHVETFDASDTATAGPAQSVKPTQGGLSTVGKINADNTGVEQGSSVSSRGEEPVAVTPKDVPPTIVNTPPVTSASDAKPEIKVEAGKFIKSMKPEVLEKVNSILAKDPKLAELISKNPNIKAALSSGDTSKLSKDENAELNSILNKAKSESLGTIAPLTMDSKFLQSIKFDSAKLEKLNNLLANDTNLRAMVADNPAILDFIKTGELPKGLNRSSISNLVTTLKANATTLGLDDKGLKRLENEGKDLVRALDKKDKVGGFLGKRLEAFTAIYDKKQADLDKAIKSMENIPLTPEGKIDFTKLPASQGRLLENYFGKNNIPNTKEAVLAGLNSAKANLNVLKNNMELLGETKGVSRRGAYLLAGNINTVLEGKGFANGRTRGENTAVGRMIEASRQINTYHEMMVGRHPNRNGGGHGNRGVRAGGNQEVNRDQLGTKSVTDILSDVSMTDQQKVEAIAQNLRRFRDHETMKGAREAATQILQDFKQDVATQQTQGISSEQSISTFVQKMEDEVFASTAKLEESLVTAVTKTEEAEKAGVDTIAVLTNNISETAKMTASVAKLRDEYNQADNDVTEKSNSFKDELSSQVTDALDRGLMRGLQNYEVEIPDASQDISLQALEDVVTEQEGRAAEAENKLVALESSFDVSEANTADLLQKFRDIIVDLDIRTRESNKGGNKGSVDTKYLDKLREIQKRWDALDKSKLEEKLATEKLKEGAQKLNLAKLKSDIGGSFNNIFSIADAQNK